MQDLTHGIPYARIPDIRDVTAMHDLTCNFNLNSNLI